MSPLAMADKSASPTIVAARRLSPSRNADDSELSFCPRFPLGSLLTAGQFAWASVHARFAETGLISRSVYPFAARHHSRVLGHSWQLEALVAAQACRTRQPKTSSLTGHESCPRARTFLSRVALLSEEFLCANIERLSLWPIEEPSEPICFLKQRFGIIGSFGIAEEVLCEWSQHRFSRQVDPNVLVGDAGDQGASHDYQNEHCSQAPR